MITMRYSQEQLLSQFPHCVTLADLFRAVEKTAEVQGRVVCQFRINGVNFTEADEKKLEPLGMAEVNLVEVLVDTPENLLNSVILNWIEELPRMVIQCDQISTALRDDGFNVQYTPIVRLIDSCQFLNESLVSMKSFSSVQSLLDEAMWNQATDQTSKAVSETVTAFEKKDSNWVADVIEYDLASSLQRWQEVLRDLYGNLTSGGHFSAPRTPFLPERA